MLPILIFDLLEELGKSIALFGRYFGSLVRLGKTHALIQIFGEDELNEAGKRVRPVFVIVGAMLLLSSLLVTGFLTGVISGYWSLVLGAILALCGVSLRIRARRHFTEYADLFYDFMDRRKEDFGTYLSPWNRRWMTVWFVMVRRQYSAAILTMPSEPWPAKYITRGQHAKNMNDRRYVYSMVCCDHPLFSDLAPAAYDILKVAAGAGVLSGIFALLAELPVIKEMVLVTASVAILALVACLCARLLGKRYSKSLEPPL